MSLTAKKMKMRCSVGLLALWVSASLFIMTQTYNMTTVVQVIEELGNKVEQTHNTFAYERSQRMVLSDEILLNLQIIYALRIQLEANYADPILRQMCRNLSTRPITTCKVSGAYFQ